MAEEKIIATGHIGNALRSTAADHTTTFTDEVFDTERQKYQSEVNTDIEQAIAYEVARAREAELANTIAIEAEKKRAEAAEQANASAIDSAVTKNEEQDQKLSELEENVAGKVESVISNEDSFGYDNVISIKIKQGKKFFLKVESSLAFSRIIIYYNGVNANRLRDTTDNSIIGKWLEYIAPIDIDKFGVYVIGANGATISFSVGYGNIVIGEKSVKSYMIDNNSVTSDKIPDGSITKEKISTQIIETIDSTKVLSENIEKKIDDSVLDLFSIEKTSNLLNPKEGKDKCFINAIGEIQYPNPSYNASGFCPVEEGKEYHALSSSDTELSMRAIAFYDNNKMCLIGKGIGNAVTSFIAPQGAVYVRINVPSSFSIENGNAGLFHVEIDTFSEYTKGSIEYKTSPDVGNKNDYSILVKKDVGEFIENKEKILGLLEEGSTKKLSVSFNNGVIIFESTEGKLVANLNTRDDLTPSDYYNQNRIFNLKSITKNGKVVGLSDDNAPVHVHNTTIGANHALPIYKVTINSHGKTNADVGTQWDWADTNKSFIIVRILDANNILMSSKAYGTEAAQSFYAITFNSSDPSKNVLKRGNMLMNFTAAASGYQMFPSVKNYSQRLMADGKTQLNDGAEKKCFYCDVVEQYDIMSPMSVLNNLISNVGATNDPIYDGESMLKVQNVYRVFPDMNIVINANIIALKDINLQNYMFAQATRIGDTSVRYYVPNSLPINGFDMRKPIAIPWGSGISSFFFNKDYCKGDSLVNRILEFNNSFGFALGFLNNQGVGKSLSDFTSTSFELRYDSGKTYPHGVDGAKSGIAISAGTMYNATMYKSFFNLSTDEDIISQYTIDSDDYTYLFVDFSRSSIKTISIDDKYNGKSVVVVESSNAVLLSDTYNNGISIKSNFVSDDTCYIVCKVAKL